MSKTIKIFILLFAGLLVFNKQLVTYYYSYKFSKWVERKFIYDEIHIDYPNLITVSGIKVLNPNPFFYDHIFESEKITLNINVKSLFFEDLVIINNLIIKNPKFFLEIEVIENLSESEDSSISYNDNIGLAKKINQNEPDKIWPKKKKDINFLILKSEIIGAKAFIKASSFTTPVKVDLSDMYFNKVGNEKNYQHYKEVLKLILFDIIGSTSDFELKKLLKKIYNY